MDSKSDLEVRQARRKLGAELRTLRGERKMTAIELATVSGISRSRISRIELGQVTPTPAVVKALVEGLRANSSVAEEFLIRARALDRYEVAEPGFEHEKFSEEQAAIFELECKKLDTHVVQYIPALLNTYDYALALIASFDEFQGDVSADRVQRRAVLRLRRQAELFDQSKHFTFIIHEAALRFPLLDNEQMVAQLEMVHHRSQLPSVDIHVVSSSSAYNWAVPFAIVDDSFVYEDSPLAGVVMFRDPNAVIQYRRLFDYRLERSLPVKESADLISSIADEFRSKVNGSSSEIVLPRDETAHSA